MNKSQKPRYILDDGTIAVFSSTKLKRAILHKKTDMELSGKKCSQQKLLEDISEDTGIAVSTIKHWCAGHNAPTDIYKVRDIAIVLNVETRSLLDNEMEESADMNNKTIENNAPITDYSTTKSVIRSVYTQMSEHIEMFRMISVVNTEMNPLNFNFISLYSQLMAVRLDIPNNVYNELVAFATNYLQQFGYYQEYLLFLGEEEVFLETSDDFVKTYTNTYDFGPCAPWCKCLYVSVDAGNKYCRAFESAIKEQYEWDNDIYNVDGIANEIIIKKAYDCIDKILCEYFV